VNPTKRIKFPK